MSNINVYSSGPMSCSVCAPSEMAPEEVEAAVNAEHPTGISSPWTISEDKTFKSGEPMPYEDPSCPGTKHWLLNC